MHVPWEHHPCAAQCHRYICGVWWTPTSPSQRMSFTLVWFRRWKYDHANQLVAFYQCRCELYMRWCLVIQLTIVEGKQRAGQGERTHTGAHHKSSFCQLSLASVFSTAVKQTWQWGFSTLTYGFCYNIQIKIAIEREHVCARWNYFQGKSVCMYVD